MVPRAKTFPIALSLVLLSLLAGCTPHPPSWPPSPSELADGATWYLDMERFQTGVHGRLVCSECHDDITPGESAAPHPDTSNLAVVATSLYDYKKCKACHPQEFTAYEQGVHAEALANPEAVKLEAPAPTCGHCHNAHYATAETRAELLVSVSEACGDCHQQAREAYEHNYHGKAALLGRETTATCADCHGAHTVLALYQPAESLPACRRCHPQANEQFASYRIHAQAMLNPDPDDPRATEFRILFWVTGFFTCLVVGVLAFFYTHTGLWFLRSLHERLRGGGRHD